VPVRRPGTTAKIALVALVLIVGVGMALELRARSGEAALVEHAAENAIDPVALIADAARRHRLIFLADVAGAVSPKRLAAEAIDTIATGWGLDAVALDVDAEQQQWIDRYLDSDPEDASVLLSHPRTLHDAEGTADAYLGLYRRVWQLNRRLGPDRRIRIIAMDIPGWPPQRALSPGQLTALFGRRDAHMFQTVQSRILDRNARGRVFFFADGLHTIEAATRVATGGTTPVEGPALAELFDLRYPGEVYSILTDAPAGRAVTAEVARYRSTRLFSVLRDRAGPELSGRDFALRADAALDLERDMILTRAQPGINFEVMPRNYSLSEVIDAYVFLSN
jgi:hypothetical protein